MISLSEIKSIIKQTEADKLPDIIKEYSSDERAGVQKELESAQKRYDKYIKELERINNMRIYEDKYSEYEFICGIDEVGRGPLAGPVVACACMLPKDCQILYVNDSKKLSESKREELYDEIMEKAVSVGIGQSSCERIDEINILNATYEAMRQAVSKLDPKPQLLLNDAVTIPGIDIRQVPIIKGDAKSISIAAASIIAKVTRDRMMVELDKTYPGYQLRRREWVRWLDCKEGNCGSGRLE